MKQKSLSLLILITTFSIDAQTLGAGDIAFIGYNTDGVDGWSFITLNDIPAGEQIYFTDQGLVNDNTWISNSEDHMVYTAPAGGVSCGTIITINDTGTSGVFTIDGPGTIGNASNGTFALSAGDQMLAYQSASGIPAAPNLATFISGVHGDDGDGTPTCQDPITGWSLNTGCSTGVSKSSIPPGLTNGVDCISLFPVTGLELDNAKYNGTLTGDINTLRAAINDRNNWIFDDGTPYPIQPANYPVPNVDCSLLSTDDVSLDNNISLFPNPTTSGTITLKNTTQTTLNSLVIMNITGQVMITLDISETVNERTIDVSNLSSGIYLVQITSEGDQVATKKLIIQ